MSHGTHASSFVVQTMDRSRRRAIVADERIIAVGDFRIEATLDVPLEARAVIVLLHAASAERFGVNSRFDSAVLGQSGFATLQVDLLTPAEEAAFSTARRPEQHYSLLLGRMLAAIDWLGNQPETLHLDIGVLVSTTETVPALMAAERTKRVRALVSRGGCPDFAQDAVGELSAPTLLIVGRNEQLRAAELASEFFARHLTLQTESRVRLDAG